MNMSWNVSKNSFVIRKYSSLNTVMLSIRQCIASGKVYYSAFLLLFGVVSVLPSPTFAQENDANVNVTVVAEGLNHPWSLIFLPDGSMMVSERSGQLRHVAADGQISLPFQGLPAIAARGQGGLLDLALDPDYETNSYLYFSYAEGDKEGKAGTAVGRARLDLDTQSLQDVEVLFQQQPKVSGPNHFGSQLVFAKDGTLFVTLGERFDFMQEAQNPANHLGAIVRITSKGAIPDNNPFVGREGYAPAIWSYGHRNVQGAALHPKTGELWVHEHGPRGGDEINIARKGGNYGWPEVSYGRHYWSTPIPDRHEEQGFKEPVHVWTPSIAPSGMAFYTADRFPSWQGRLFVGALAQTHLAMLTLEENKVVNETRLLDDLGARIRDVAQGPDGFLYVLTDEDNGRILRISP
jgi:glucose/arabinose dehydrogenase